MTMPENPPWSAGVYGCHCLAAVIPTVAPPTDPEVFSERAAMGVPVVEPAFGTGSANTDELSNVIASRARMRWILLAQHALFPRADVATTVDHLVESSNSRAEYR